MPVPLRADRIPVPGGILHELTADLEELGRISRQGLEVAALKEGVLDAQGHRKGLYRPHLTHPPDLAFDIVQGGLKGRRGEAAGENDAALFEHIPQGLQELGMSELLGGAVLPEVPLLGKALGKGALQTADGGLVRAHQIELRPLGAHGSPSTGSQVKWIACGEEGTTARPRPIMPLALSSKASWWTMTGSRPST